MKRLFLPLGFALALLAVPVHAQAPGNAPPYPVSAPTPTVSISATGTSSRVALGSDVSTFPVVALVNNGTAKVFCQKGGVTVTADSTSNYLVAIPSGGYRSFWGGSSTYIACVTATGLATVDVSQQNGGPILGMLGGGSGGTPGGSNTQLQYNNAGAFGGISTFVSNGTTVQVTDGDLLFENAAVTGGSAIHAPPGTAGHTDFTLPPIITTDTLVGIAAVQSLSNKTLVTPILAAPVAVASLGTCNAGAFGTWKVVNDGNAVSAWNGVSANGGALIFPVWCDGTNWRNR